MQLFWNAFYLVATLVLWPRWLWRALTRGEYVGGLWQKFTGRPPPLPDSRPVIWMHGVCLGEVLLLRPLIDHLQRHAAEHQAVLSTTSRSGMTAAQRAYPTVPAFFLPFDFTWTIRRIYESLRPRVLVLSELELWPNLLLEAGRRGVPVLIASSRINDADWTFFRRINRWHRPALRCVSWWGAQTARDAERIEDLLGPGHSTQVVVTGSLKFDAALCDVRAEVAGGLRQLLNYAADDRVLVAGSTHDPEERLLLDLLDDLRPQYPQLRLLLAPREPHRFGAVESLLARRGVPYVRRSRVTSPLSESPIVTLLDSVGELPAVWLLANFAFVGGTWAPGVGGQNPLEPAAHGTPLCFGPNIWNFEQPVRALTAAGAAAQFQTPEELATIIHHWLKHPLDALRRGSAGAEVVHSCAGAAEPTIRALRKLAGLDAAVTFSRRRDA